MKNTQAGTGSAPKDPRQTKEGVYTSRLSDTAARGHHGSFRTDDSFFRQIVESLEDYSVFTTDTEGVISSWNKGSERIFGYTEEEAIGRNGQMLYVPEDIEQGEPEKELRVAIEDGRAQDEKWHVRKDGERFWAYGLTFPLRDDQGDIRGFTKIARDLTGRKQAEEREAEILSERMRLVDLFRQAPAMIAVSRGENFVYEFANPLFLKAVGKTEAIIGKPLLEAMPELKGQPILDILYGVFRTGEPFYGRELPVMLDVNNNGKTEEVYFNFVYQPVRDGEGNIDGVMTHAVDVTGQVLLRRKIEQSEERYRALFDTIDEGFCVIEMIFDEAGTPVDYRFLETNPAFEKKTGLSNAVGRTVRELVPDLEPFWYGRYGRVAKSGRPERFEQESPVLGRSYDVFASRVGGEGSRRVAIVFNDVTARKRSEERLRESEERFRTLIQESGDAIQLVTPEGKVLYSSESVLNVLGYTPEEIQGVVIAPYIHPDDLEAFGGRLNKLLETPKGRDTLQYRIKHKDGSWVWVETTLTNHLDTANINALVGNFRNITARKEAEEALKRSRDDFKTVADAIPQIVWVTRPDGYHEYYNRRWYEFTNTTYEETQGEGWNAQFHPDDQERARERWNHSLKTGEQYEIEYRLRNGKTGQWRWFLGRALPIRDEKGSIIRWFGTCTDIHEQKELQRHRDEFLGIASHELKTPVTSIKAYTQVLERSFRRRGDEKAADQLGKMDAQINRLNRLIADLLDVTKIQSGRLQFNEEDFDFNPLVGEVAEEVQRTTEQHTIEMKLGPEVRLHGDRERIGQVVANLLTNAIKYSPQADRVVVSSQAGQGEISLSIQDFGIGISQEKQPRVFEQFFRVSGTKENTFPGLGLGLYIASEIIKRQGGRIWLASEEGEGSTFSFALPLPGGKDWKAPSGKTRSTRV